MNKRGTRTFTILSPIPFICSEHISSPRVPQGQVFRIYPVLEAPRWSGLMIDDALHGA